MRQACGGSGGTDTEMYFISAWGVKINEYCVVRRGVSGIHLTPKESENENVPELSKSLF